MAGDIETMEFQAEARQLLQLVIHSVYSNKDIFLRELISNASDALDKLRLAVLRDKDLDADISDLHIEIETDPARRTLTVRDNGIGMSRDEVIDLVGTIARSGTAELIEGLKAGKDPAAARDLIGRFGVGFYASFMVADKVSLRTRRAGHRDATRWESDGQGTYTVEAVSDAAPGTSVTLYLKEVDEDDRMFDYTAKSKIREIVKAYSDFIPWPITTEVEHTDADGTLVRQVETLNSMKALWARSKDEVKEDEYHEFYRHISHDWANPLETIQMRGEGNFEYEALLFIPSRAPADLFHQDGRRGVQLYVKRVFIMADCDALMPAYLRFVKGVVDARDLSLNVSRELLQQDRQIHIIARRLVKRVLSTIKTMMTDHVDRYRIVWAAFGRCLKEGLLTDVDNTEAILEVASFASTHDASELTGLRDYVGRMKDGQEVIYYLTGDSRTRLESSPHLEAFRAKGYEVLLLTDPVDEVWVDAVPGFDGRRFQSIAKGEVDLDTDDERASAAEDRERLSKDFAPLLAWIAAQLDEVKEVRLSSRLTTSPACIVADAGDISPALAGMLRAVGQEVPASQPILELNPAHALILGLRQAHQERVDSDESLAETVALLYGMAVLADGGELADPLRFSRLLTDRLLRTL